MEFADKAYGSAESMVTDKPYKEARDEQRLQSRIAKDQYPGAHHGGTAAGLAAQILATGEMSALVKVFGKKAAQKLDKETLEKQVSKGMVIGGAIGAVGGVGRSEKEKTGEILEDAARDATAGTISDGGITGAGHVLKKGKEAIGKGLKYTKEKGTEAATSLTSEHQNFIKKNLPLIKKTSDVKGTADKVVNRMNQLSQKNHRT